MMSGRGDKHSSAVGELAYPTTISRIGFRNVGSVGGQTPFPNLTHTWDIAHVVELLRFWLTNLSNLKEPSDLRSGCIYTSN